MVTVKQGTNANGATGCSVGCMIWGGTPLRYIHTAENETIRAICAVSLLVVCIISTDTVNYTHIHSFMSVKCVKKCLLMPATSRCTVLHITVRGPLHAFRVTNRSGRSVSWKSMFVFILVLNPILVESVFIRSRMPSHWRCILGTTQGRNHLPVTCVSSHSIGNIISFVTFRGDMAVKYIQVDHATCLRKTCWVEAMHVQWVGNKGFQQKGHLEAHMHVNNHENSLTCDVWKCAFSNQNSLRRHCWFYSSCTESLVSCGIKDLSQKCPDLNNNICRLTLVTGQYWALWNLCIVPSDCHG